MLRGALRSAVAAWPARCFAILGFTVLGFTTGCALQAYPGPRRERSDVARIEPTGWIAGTQIALGTIDGNAFHWLQESAEVLPGHHVLRADLVLRSGLEQQVHHFEIDFDPEAGRHYTVLGELSVHGPRMWIADDDFNTVAEVDVGMRAPDVSAKQTGEPALRR